VFDERNIVHKKLTQDDRDLLAAVTIQEMYFQIYIMILSIAIYPVTKLHKVTFIWRLFVFFRILNHDKGLISVPDR